MKIVYTWLILSLGFLVPLFSQTLVFWPLTPDKLGSPETSVEELDAFDLIRGNGLSVLQFSGSGVSAQNWSTTTSPQDATVDYYEFGFRARPGETLDINRLLFAERRSSSGPRQFRVFYSLDNFSTQTELFQFSLPDNISQRNHIIPISRKISNGQQIHFRFYAYEAESNSGSWTLLANRLKVIGRAMQSCTAPTEEADLDLINAEATTASIRVNGGSGQARLVVIAPADMPMAPPYQGDAYHGDLIYGSGDELGAQTFVLAATEDMATDLFIQGLNPGTTYRVAVYEYNTGQMCYAEHPMMLTFTTACDVQARSVYALQHTALDEEVAVRWEAPVCAGQFLVVVSESPINGSPLPQDYDASAYYGNAATAPGFDPGTYPVYYDSNTEPLRVWNLENGTTYYFAVYVRNGNNWSAASTFTATPEAGCYGQNGERIYINEIHYRNGPVSQDQGIEIAGPAGIDLRAYELAVYQVAGSGPPIFIELHRFALNGAIDDEGAGFGAVWFPTAGMPEWRGYIVLTNIISGQIVDRIGYDTSVGFLDEVDPPVTQYPTWTVYGGLIESSADAPGFSIQRMGEGVCPADFIWARLPNTRGRLNIGQSILPVELSFLGAEPVDKMARVYWQTITESGSDYFVLERSSDGRHFTELTQLPAAGFSAEKIDYEFYDRQPLSGQNFYRLREIDYDGTEYDLGIVSVSFNGESKPELDVFPNPVVDQTTVQWNWASERLVLLDIQGRVLQQWPLNDFSEGGSQAVDLSLYPSGIYLLRLEGEEESLVRRVFKE